MISTSLKKRISNELVTTPVSIVQHEKGKEIMFFLKPGDKGIIHSFIRIAAFLQKTEEK